MSYVFFQDVLAALGKRIAFESISNLYGRTIFDKKGGDSINKTIENANPLTKVNTHNSANVLIGMPSALAIIDARGDKDQQKQMEKALGDTSWFDEYIK